MIKLNGLTGLLNHFELVIGFLMNLRVKRSSLKCFQAMREANLSELEA
jgi:hypothetical protein